ncbi:MAG TPA: hypothetical protein VMT63_14225 [Bacteroidales bacterium]|nr:hypothetical protein [Bacteroidales bacterium]
MKTKIILSAILSCEFYLLSSQVPQGFNYQAAATNSSGIPLANKEVQVKIGILSDTLVPTVMWEELHDTLTNPSGVINVVIGKGLRQAGVSKFSDIDWTGVPLYIRIKLCYQGTWRTMGSAKLWAVPYAMTSGGFTISSLSPVGSLPEKYVNLTKDN